MLFRSRDALDRAAGLVVRHQRLHGDAQKWMWLVASQGFAVAFHVAAIATALGLVVFSDLAFGWSTTAEEVNAARLHAVSDALAAPWSLVLPDAVPTRELIERTRYFRGAGGPPFDPVGSAAWWRFLLACMACYGLAPRLAALGFAVWRQQAALRRVFDSLPGVAELRDRLDSRWVATAATEAEAGGAPAPAPVRRARRARPARVRAVRWSGIPIADAEVSALVASALGAELDAVVDGGAGSGREDAALVAELAAGDAAPLFLVKAWEPPLLEMQDLLVELREACEGPRPILVLPLARDAAGGLAPARDEGARSWARRLDAVGDPWLDVVTEAAG